MNKKLLAATFALALSVTPVAKIMSCQSYPEGKLTFNNVSPNLIKDALSVAYFSYNDTALTMRIASPNKPGSVVISWKPAQRKHFLDIKTGDHFYDNFYVQVKDEKGNLFWYALPVNKNELR